MREAIRRPTRDGVLGPASWSFLGYRVSTFGVQELPKSDPRRLQSSLRTYARIVIDFGWFGPRKITSNCFQNGTKIHPKIIQFDQSCSKPFSIDFWIVFQGARPSIWLLFITLSRGRAFFSTSGKVPKMITQIVAKYHSKRVRNHPKINWKTNGNFYFRKKF